MPVGRVGMNWFFRKFRKKLVLRLHTIRIKKTKRLVSLFMVGGWSEPGMREIDHTYRKNKIIDATEKIKQCCLIV